MFRELVIEVKECKKCRTTICISAEVLDQLLDLYFLHLTHPTQKAVVQHKDNVRRAKENERNRFNGPNYLIFRRSPVRIVDEAGPSNRTEPVPDTTDPLLTQELTVQPTLGPQTSQPDKRPHLHSRGQAKEIATSQLKKQKITTKPPTRMPQRNLNFEEVTTETSVPPTSANTARSTQTRLQARNQQGTETKQRSVRVLSTSTQVVQKLSTDDEDNNHETTPPSPTLERPRSLNPVPTNMALVTFVPNPTHQPEPEMDRLKRMATEDEDPANSLRRHVAQVQQYQATARLLQDAPIAYHRALRYVTDLKAALRSALNHHDNARRELTEEQATTYQLRHEIEHYHHNAVARARQLEEFEAELLKKLPMEKELQTLRATHQSLRDKVVKLKGLVADLQATNAEWAAAHIQQHELIVQMEANAQTTTAFIDNRTRYFCQIMWKLVQVSRDYRDLLQAHHQLQDDLRNTQRRKKQLRTQVIVRIVQLQAQMRMLRHEAATVQQQLQFYQAQHLTTAVSDDLSSTAEDEEVTKQEDENQMKTLQYKEDELDLDDEETTNPLNQPTYDLTIPLPYGPTAPPPDDSTPVANEALFQVAQDTLTEFFATLPNNLRRGAATAEEDTTMPTQSESAVAKLVPFAPLQISPTVAALSMLAHGNPPPPIPTKGQTQTGPDSSSHTPLRLVITSESEGEYYDNSKVGDTDEEEAVALIEALLEEDNDDDQSEDDANTTGTAIPGQEDPYDIQGLGDVPVAITPTSSSHMDISSSPK